MTAKPVEWALVIYYGSSAHRATYGRNVRDPQGSSKYTKDYIQLSQKADFIDTIKQIFPFAASVNDPIPLRYKWPTGSTTGALTWSADRHHLKWETSLGAPAPWKMTLTPSDASAETIPGDPTHTNFEDAEQELELLASRGAGKPYLVAVKLRDEPSTLHLRVYLKDANSAFDWADLGQTPTMVQDLATRTSRDSALAWSLFPSGGEAPSGAVENVLTEMNEAEEIEAVLARLDRSTGQAVAAYLRRPGYGIFFDPAKNHNAWLEPAPFLEGMDLSVADILAMLEERFPVLPQNDSAAEAAESDPVLVEEFQKRIEHQDYSIADATATVKTRGSAQHAFADAVKANYSYRCAVTGIATREFLVASHIVPWAEDASIRLDPANGICLSLIIDRAFEKGYLLVEDDMTLRVDRKRVGSDAHLLAMLEPHDGTALSAPSQEPPNPEYLRRRRVLVSKTLD